MTFDRSSVTIERTFEVGNKAETISGIALLSAVATGTIKALSTAGRMLSIFSTRSMLDLKSSAASSFS